MKVWVLRRGNGNRHYYEFEPDENGLPKLFWSKEHALTYCFRQSCDETTIPIEYVLQEPKRR